MYILANNQTHIHDYSDTNIGVDKSWQDTAVKMDLYQNEYDHHCHCHLQNHLKISIILSFNWSTRSFYKAGTGNFHSAKHQSQNTSNHYHMINANHTNGTEQSPHSRSVSNPTFISFDFRDDIVEISSGSNTDSPAKGAGDQVKKTKKRQIQRQMHKNTNTSQRMLSCYY